MRPDHGNVIRETFSDSDQPEAQPADDFEVKEACGIFGVFGHPEAAAVVREGLFSLQHRGQEGAGITVSDGEHIRSIRGLGLLNEVMDKEDITTLKGHLAIGHVRYSTTGTSRRINNVQPLVGECVDGLWVVAHNGNLVNAHKLRRQYQEAGALFQTGMDSEVLLHLLADAKHRNRPNRVISALDELKGAFAFLLMNKNQIIGVRDPHGFKPLSIGRLGKAWVFASESCALTQIGATYERDILPGEIVTVDDSGIHLQALTQQVDRHAHCVFEMVYFARPDSKVFSHHVHLTRLKHGQRLAIEHPVDADCVVPVPDSGNFAALGYSKQSGIPFEYAFIRNHYVGRTFIMPGQSTRMALADRKLSVIPDTLTGKRIIVVDDSLVRGTTMQRRVAALRKAGVKEVHLRIACPPVAHPCFYGIDFPTREELAAGTHTIDEIRDMVGADSLGYLSVEGLLSPFYATEGFCRACFTGHYPIPKGETDKGLLERNQPARDSIRRRGC